MSLCCIGPVCIPDSALWPLLIFLLKYIWEKLGSLLRRVGGLEKPVAIVDEAELPAEVEVARVGSMEDWQARVAASGTQPLVVDFTASWCKPCKKMAPLFGRLAAKYAAAATFVAVDIDECDDVAVEANVMAVPTFQVYVDGLPVDQLSGAGDDALHRFVATTVEKHSGSKTQQACCAKKKN